MFEQYVTISCVSNEVGGNLVGNAKWTGVRLRDVLEMAGVQTSATQLVGRSVDGWTAGMPVAWVMDPAREPMIAVKMNDEPLPPVHGYPARLIVPGLYGYVSATKWLGELELTTLEAFNGYWVPLGWSKEAPILTQSRIDTPRGGVSAGTVPIAGIAWAPDRGICKVEVGIDGRGARRGCHGRSRTRRGSSGSWTGPPRPAARDPGPSDRRDRAVQPETADPARARRRAGLAHHLGRTWADASPAAFFGRIGIESRSCHDDAISSTRPNGSWPARSAGRATEPSSSRHATAHAWSASSLEKVQVACSPTGSATSLPSSSAAG